MYEIEALRKRVLELLRKEDRLMSLGQICVAMEVPHWAVSKALESAYQAGQAEYCSGAGWCVKQAEVAPQQIAEAGDELL